MCPLLLKDALICVYPLARGYLPCFCNKCICYTTHVVGWGTVESLEGISFALAAPPAEDRIHQQGNKCISVTGVAYHRIWMKGLLMPHVSCLFQALAGFTDKVYISSHLSPEALLLTRSQGYEGWTMDRDVSINALTLRLILSRSLRHIRDLLRRPAPFFRPKHFHSSSECWTQLLQVGVSSKMAI